MKTPLLIITLLLITSLSANGAIALTDTTEYLSVSHRLDLLCTTLYGEKHPLTDYITSYRQLIAHYGSLAQQVAITPNPQMITEAQTLRVTLDTIREYALNMLNKYQVVTGEEISPLPTAPLPPTALPPHPPAPIQIQPVPTATPIAQNQATQEYIAAMQTLPAQHYSGPMGQQPDSRNAVFKDQISLLLTGLAIIGICTYIGRKMFGRDIDRLRQYKKRQEVTTSTVNAHAFVFDYNSQSIVPQGETL